MTNAAQGNPMIPSHPSIQAAHAQASTTGPSPSSNGATPPASPAQPPAQNFEMDWASMAMGLEDEGGSPPQSGAQPPATQNAQPGQAQPPSPQGELSPEQKEAIARANMEAQGQPPAQAQPGQPNVSPEEAVNKAVAHLLNTTYKLSDEQKQELVSKPDEAIPQLAARMHVQIATTLATYMQQAMQQMVPQMALSAMNKQMGAFKAEQTFFGQYPALNKPEFRPVVLQSLKLAKAYNPNFTRDQVMKEAAELAAFKLKVSLGAPQQQQPPAQQRQPHTPASMPAASMPFMPAPPGGAPAANVQQGQPGDNIFAALADDPNW